MEKSPEAFRTISEVADLLDTPAHVLRFWESRFPQIRPVKRAGGRRYYRPGDVALLAGIKKLLHDDGLTIRGVQKILREQGIKHVSALAAPLPDPLPGVALVAGEGDEAEVSDAFILSALTPPARPADTAKIIPLDQAFARLEAQRTSPVQDANAPDVGQPDGAGLPPDEEAPEAPFIEAEEEAEPLESLPLFTKAGLHAPPVSKDAVAQVGKTEEASPPRQERDEQSASLSPEAARADDAAPDVEGDQAEVTDNQDEPPQPTVAALLRRCNAAKLASRKAELGPLHHRLADLRDRVAEASRRRVR